MMEEGKKIENFCLKGIDKNKEEKEFCYDKDFKGKWLVLYFYPKDNTPGCTNEGKDFSKLKEEFEKEGAIIVGVSADSIKSHINFAEKQGLKIILLSDTEKKLIKKMAWGKKKLYGREYEGIIRSTYLIDPEGNIRKVWSPVKVKGHAEEVLEELRKLKREQAK